MGSFSFWHILILAIIILLLFGGNRFSAMMGDVAKGLKSFKQGMTRRRQARGAPRSAVAAPQRRPSHRRDARAAAHGRACSALRRRPLSRSPGRADVRRRHFRAYPHRGSGADLHRPQGPADGLAHRRALGRTGARHGASFPFGHREYHSRGRAGGDGEEVARGERPHHARVSGASRRIRRPHVSEQPTLPLDDVPEPQSDLPPEKRELP